MLHLKRGKVFAHDIHNLLVNNAHVPPLVVSETLKAIRTSFQELSRIVPNQWLSTSNQKNEVKVLGSDVYTVNSTAGDVWNSTQWVRSHYLVPGTHSWSTYRSMRQVAFTFVDSLLPILTGNARTTGRALFTPDACLVDSRQVLNDNLQEFYVSLADARRRTFATWELERATVLEGWNDTTVGIRIDYTIQADVGSRSMPRFTCRGSDVFTLRHGSDVVQMQRVEQLSLTIAGVDGSWLMNSIVKSFEADRVIQISARGWERLSIVGSLSYEPPIRTLASLRSDTAALRVYRCMESLHMECRNLFAEDGGVVPGSRYMANDIKLQGYLNEILLSGRTTYLRSLGWSLQALRQAIEARQVLLLDPPQTKIELTANGSLLCLLSVELDLAPLLPELPLPLASQADALSSLHLQVLSEYAPNDNTGEIETHTLVETRINGKLAPVDVVARALKRKTLTTGIMGIPNLEWVGLVKDVLEFAKTINN